MKRVFAAAALLALVSVVRAADPTLTISNPLGLDFPHELVHWDVPSEQVPAGDLVVEMGGQTRPAQRDEGARVPGKTRVWFIAMIKGGKDAEKASTVTLKAGKAESPLSVATDKTRYTITNGVYAIRIADYNASGPPTELDKFPPLIQGLKLADGKEFVGTFAWKGRPDVLGIRTSVVASGPVLSELRVQFAQRLRAPRPGPTGLGDCEMRLRFVAGDPWIEVSEEFGDEWSGDYSLTFAEDMKPDTAMFVPWFEYGRFGGNNQLRFHKLEPREKQTGPFAKLQARWTQQPGGAQDFFVTTTGTPGQNGGDPGALAVGVVAIKPGTWAFPYENTISAFAEGGSKARVEFAYGGSRAGKRERMSRTYALCVGPKSAFDNTGRLNSLVRRHADWRLDDQIHKYILEWERKPELAGPHILATRAEIEQIQADWKASKDTPAVRTLKEFAEKGGQLKSTERDVFELLTEGKAKSVQMPSAGLWLGSRYQDDFLNPTTATRFLNFTMADLFANGKPQGGAWQAAIGYIFSDLNQWPGWYNGWNPGNPNFHTDKYKVAIHAGAAMLDHPHAKEWLAFGKRNFDEDIAKVLYKRDGVGWECPGYSGYSANHQLELARVFLNVGMGNPAVENPLWKKTATWHRHLLTPVDVRLGLRHEAPIGDTHRWTSGFNDGFGKLAKFYKAADPKFAGEAMGVYEFIRAQGGRKRGSLVEELFEVDASIAATPFEKLEWGSHAFYGFGSIMRSRFGTADETFVTFKAGPARGHYHNDELSYHFYGMGTPLSLDYNCSYHPRGDHAALHNSMTFGVAKPLTHQGDAKEVEAAEQLHGTAQVGAFASTADADIVVAERSDTALALSPVYPDNAKFQYPYPRREVEKIVHRRTLVLVKHPAGGKLADYLVVRDQTVSKEPQQVNIHLLAREVAADKSSDSLLRAQGQWDVDALVFVAHAEEKKVDVGRWYYVDEKSPGPDYKGADAPVDAKKGEDPAKPARDAWQKRIAETDGAALIPPAGHSGKWMYGEYQKWIKLQTKPGSDVVWVLYPVKKGQPEPTFKGSRFGVDVTLGDENEMVRFSENVGDGARNGPGGCWISRKGGGPITLLGHGQLPALGEMRDVLADRPEKP